MTQHMGKIIFNTIGIWLLTFCFFSLPFPLLAAPCDPKTATKLCDPLNNTNVADIIGLSIKIILPLAGAVVLLMLLAGAIFWIISAGNPEKVKQGKDTVVWAILGAVVILGSYVALSFILKALTIGVPGYQPK